MKKLMKWKYKALRDTHSSTGELAPKKERRIPASTIINFSALILLFAIVYMLQHFGHGTLKGEKATTPSSDAPGQTAAVETQIDDVVSPPIDIANTPIALLNPKDEKKELPTLSSIETNPSEKVEKADAAMPTKVAPEPTPEKPRVIRKKKRKLKNW